MPSPETALVATCQHCGKAESEHITDRLYCWSIWPYTIGCDIPAPGFDSRLRFVAAVRDAQENA